MGSRAVGSAWPVAARPGRFRRWWLDRSVRAKGLIVIAVPLIATTSASLALPYQEHQVRTVSRAASAVVTWADQVLIDAINAETAVRGYAVTRDPAFLRPYNDALTRIGADRILGAGRHLLALINGGAVLSCAV